MNKETIANLIGKFYCNYGTYSFIETEQGNFIYADSRKNGSGNIYQTNSTLEDFMKVLKILFIKEQGKHKISDYCLDFNFKGI